MTIRRPRRGLEGCPARGRPAGLDIGQCCLIYYLRQCSPTYREAPHAPQEEPQPVPTARRPPRCGEPQEGALLLVLLVAQLMVILDITAVNIALPSLAQGSAAHRLADQLDDHELLPRLRKPLALRRARRRPARAPSPVPHGPRRLHGLVPRLGTAGTAGALFAARAGQGLGAAMLSPAALSIITSCFHGHAKAKALAAWGAVGGAGAAIGVLAGGLLTEFADWRMIFYVNLPVAVVLAIAAVQSHPGRHRAAEVARTRSARRDFRDNESRRDRLCDHPGFERRLDIDPNARLRSCRTRRARCVRCPGNPHG